ncbi:MAG: SrfA family protein [Ewingella sp.]
MAKSFLRSGSLDEILALGENGQPVYASALQLRETLRLRNQQSVANVLAIPQPNEAGDRIDWYSPVAGKVTSWLAASDAERASAVMQLEQCRAIAHALCQKALKSDNPGQQLFGALLAKAIQFPDQNHVYLVDGKPVLTFWGFVHLDKKSRTDALDCLRPPVAPPEYSLVDKPLAAVSKAAPVITPKAPPKTQTENAPEFVSATMAKPSAGNSWLRFWWLIPGAALLVTLVMQFTGVFAPTASPVPEKPLTPVVAEKRALPATPLIEEKAAVVIAPPAIAPEPVSGTPVVAPVAAETVVAPATVPAAEPQNTPVVPEDKNALTMPSDAVKVGSTKFLNGTWKVMLDIKTPVTGKPPSLKYQIKNGKGVARILYGDGMSCKADINAGLMSSGNLVINSRFKAKCSDGSRYQMPEIVCTQALSGPADCKGRYDGNTVFPMTMKRESK